MQTLTITECLRRNNTSSGNPRYQFLDTDGYFYLTAPDTQAAHSLPASIYPGMTTPATVQVETDTHGQITSIQEG